MSARLVYNGKEQGEGKSTEWRPAGGSVGIKGMKLNTVIHNNSQHGHHYMR